MRGFMCGFDNLIIAHAVRTLVELFVSVLSGIRAVTGVLDQWMSLRL